MEWSENHQVTKRVFGQKKQKAVSENSGTPKSSILIGFSVINHPFWGTPMFGNTHNNLPIREKKSTSQFGMLK